MIGMLLASTLSSAATEAPCTSIRFARGATSTIVAGSVPADSRNSDAPSQKCYSLSVAKGQRAHVRILKGPNVGITIPGVQDQNDSIEFTTEARTYEILLMQVEPRPSPHPFRMSVEVSSLPR